MQKIEQLSSIENTGDVIQMLRIHNKENKTYVTHMDVKDDLVEMANDCGYLNYDDEPLGCQIS